MTLLLREGVIESMSRRACCWDSAPIESFWGRLKTECVYWEDFTTRQAALQTIHTCIEVEYHLCRAHSGIGYATPAEFENEFALASRAMNE